MTRTFPPERLSVKLDGSAYQVEVVRKVDLPANAPRLLVVSYQPNPMAEAVLHVCLAAIRKMTPEPYELWVIDNCSPPAYTGRLRECSDINLVLNHTLPLPPKARAWWRRLVGRGRQQRWGSYANAVGLELGVRLIDPRVHLIMPLHMDTLPAHPTWLSFLRQKLSDQVRASGMLLHTDRVAEGVLHVLGFLVDFQLFQRLKLDFYPQLPGLDVGDRVTIGLRQSGFQVYGCHNTYANPELASRIPEGSPFRSFPVLRAMDDQDRVIFLHLSRGVRKTTGEHARGVSAQEWVRFAERTILD